MAGAHSLNLNGVRLDEQVANETFEVVRDFSCGISSGILNDAIGW